MALKPEEKEPKKMYGFRPDRDHADWLDSLSPSQTSALQFAVRLAREYYEAVRPLYARLEVLAKADGYTMIGLVARLLRAGLDAYEVDRKSKK